MRKKLLFCIWIIVFLFFGVLMVNFISNERMISKYNSGVYEFNKLSALGFTQPYIRPYNNGNIYYMQGEYELAIASYDQALTKHPTKNAICDIIVNKSLSMLQLFSVEYEKKADIDPIIDKLLEVEEVLLSYGCANADLTSGHDEEAQQLYNEIEDCINELAAFKDTFTFYGDKVFCYDTGQPISLKGDEFEFVFVEIDGNTGAAIGDEIHSKNMAGGLISLFTITYRLEDAGTHYYKIYEIPGDDDTIVYSTSKYTLAVDLTVSYNGRTLDAVVGYNADIAEQTEITFTNFKPTGDGDGDGDGGGGSGNGGGDGGNGGGDSGGDGGDPADPNNPGGGNITDPGTSTPVNPQPGDTPTTPMPEPTPSDPIGDQLQDLMNQANDERYEEFYNSGNYNPYNGDCW